MRFIGGEIRLIGFHNASVTPGYQVVIEGRLTVDVNTDLTNAKLTPREASGLRCLNSVRNLDQFD